MSTVTNPYTFNIESNCEFSTDTLVTTKATLIMKYDQTETTRSLNYGSNFVASSLVPNKFSDTIIKSIILSESIDYIQSCTVSVSNEKYSKIILNCVLFSNLELIRGINISSSTVLYNANNIVSNINPVDWNLYDGDVLDLTIEFV